MHMLQSLFYLTIALHVSGIIITHLQEHKTTVTTPSCWDLYIRILLRCTESCILNVGDTGDKYMCLLDYVHIVGIQNARSEKGKKIPCLAESYECCN